MRNTPRSHRALPAVTTDIATLADPGPSPGCIPDARIACTKLHDSPQDSSR